ncbi:thermonuclease family protein [Rhizobium hainanense]|uniref:Endonuclease YncB, thermonuclease family n=1 Tax=Rhizobium hainanense TaxID=52131 RepID=A0A1C3WL67_9HYPH|nr:succinoglycan biosynthesis protein exoi [Rhizobium hainanense]SCB40474.1 Endonuclease YncB, thermonuclease family [Rhizobium hainanense]
MSVTAIAAIWAFGTLTPAVPSFAQATQQTSRTFAVPATGLTFLTGDSWQQSGQTMRLYGVQACLRGSTYTDKAGQKQDCGAVSLAMLAAIVRDTRPTCAPVVQLSTGASSSISPQGSPGISTILVICSAHVGGHVLDLGTILITQGFAFAALTSSGASVYPAYAAEETIAQSSRVGLWAFPDMPHPNRTLLFQPAGAK